MTNTSDELELLFTAEEQQCVHIAILNDNIVEGTEEFEVDLLPGIGSNLIIGTFRTINVIIEDSSSKSHAWMLSTCTYHSRR